MKLGIFDSVSTLKKTDSDPRLQRLLHYTTRTPQITERKGLG